MSVSRHIEDAAYTGVSRKELRGIGVSEWRRGIAGSVKPRVWIDQRPPVNARFPFKLALVAALTLAAVSTFARAHSHGEDTIELVSGNTVYLLEQCDTSLQTGAVQGLNANCKQTTSWPNTDSNVLDQPEYKLNAVSSGGFSLVAGCLGVSYLSQPSGNLTYFLNCNDVIFSDGFEKDCQHD